MGAGQFFVQDGRVYMDTAFIRELHATKIIAGTIDASRLVLNGVSTDRIALNAATEMGLATGNGAVQYTMFLGGGGNTQILTYTFNQSGRFTQLRILASGTHFLTEGCPAGERMAFNIWGFTPGYYTIRAETTDGRSDTQIRLMLLNTKR